MTTLPSSRAWRSTRRRTPSRSGIRRRGAAGPNLRPRGCAPAVEEERAVHLGDDDDGEDGDDGGDGGVEDSGSQYGPV